MPTRHTRRTVACRVLASLILLLCATVPAAAQTGVSKGQRILIERGLQIQGMVTKDDVFHPDTYKDANYTAINWLWESNPAMHGPAPGFPWARWAGGPGQMPHNTPAETPYLPSLIAVQIADEQNLNDPAVRDSAINWFNSVRASYPNTILYANNFGGQVDDASLGDFISRARPDMISFDTYPWRSDYTTRQPAPPAGGSPAGWYSDLRRYREHARHNNIPLATYRQSFHAVQDYDQTVYRDPSPSEFRLNTFAALAYNAKYVMDFTYNTGASSYFTTPGGDSNPTPLYAELKQVNHEARNLGKALVHLKPVADVATPDQRTTGIQIIRGQHQTPTGNVFNPLPIGFAPDPSAAGYSDWEFGRNDPYLSGWVTSNAGTTNNGLRGDVILSWFNVLDESTDGDAFSNEVYLMVTNGLSGPAATAAETRQQIVLDFGSTNPANPMPYPYTTIQRLNRQTGLVEELPLASVSGKRRLTLVLDGGTSELLKFPTGAPFVGVPEPTSAVSAGAAAAVLAMKRRQRR